MQNKILNQRVNFIDLWKIRSDELYRAAKVVWDSEVIDHSNDGDDDRLKIHLQYRPATLLMGLSLETMLKACIIANRPISLGKDYPKDLSHHKLIDLYKLAGFCPSELEVSFLNHLTASIEWTSKYPTPIRESSYKTDALIRNEGHFITFSVLHGNILKKFPTHAPQTP